MAFQRASRLGPDARLGKRRLLHCWTSKAAKARTKLPVKLTMPAKNKDWTRDEHILAFNLYCKIPFGRQHSRAPEIIELAKLLGRSPNSVALKLNNFSRLHP